MIARVFVNLTSLLLLICMAGCGGGTRGSGGQLYDGSVTDTSGRALENVDVTILATGDSGITDANGQFSIETEPQTGGVEFLLEGTAFSGRVTTEPIPDNASRVFVRFAVGAGDRPEIASNVEVRERKPARTPTATATSAQAPIPQPTIVEETPETPAPVPIPTITAVPTSAENGNNGNGNEGGKGNGNGSGNGNEGNKGNGPGKGKGNGQGNGNGRGNSNGQGRN